MTKAHAVVVALGIVLATGLIPALAQSSMTMMPDAGAGITGHRQGMSGGMSGGCVGIMRSMNGGGGQPNSQWRTYPPSDGSMVN